MQFSLRADGQGLVEYALIIMFVAIVVVGILALFGPALGNAYSTICKPFGC